MFDPRRATEAFKSGNECSGTKCTLIFEAERRLGLDFRHDHAKRSRRGHSKPTKLTSILSVRRIPLQQSGSAGLLTLLVGVSCIHLSRRRSTGLGV